MGNIGKRAAEAILQRVGSHKSMDAELDRLMLTRQGFYSWESGKHTPGGKMLQRMALAGYDVHWILTGERKKTMKVEIIKYPTEEDWLLVKKCTLVTVGKETNKPPTEIFKESLLRSRHSPIRELRFLFYLTDVPYWVSTHLCRHVHAQPYVKTQRNDRQDSYDRNKAPQDAPVDMMWSVNGEELITIANKRLCRQASEETRDLVKMICDEVIKVCPEFKDELVPMCVRNGGVCYEIFPCGGKDDA